MCEGVHVHVCMMHVDQGTVLGIIPQERPPFLLKDLTGLELARWIRLADQRGPGIRLSLPP